MSIAPNRISPELPPAQVHETEGNTDITLYSFTSRPIAKFKAGSVLNGADSHLQISAGNSTGEPLVPTIEAVGDAADIDVTILAKGAGVVNIPALVVPGGGPAAQHDTVDEFTLNSGVTVEGVLLKDNDITMPSGAGIAVDVVTEATLDAGVTVETVLVKDGSVTLDPSGILRANEFRVVDGTIITFRDEVNFQDDVEVKVNKCLTTPCIAELNPAQGMDVLATLKIQAGDTLEVDAIDETTMNTGVTIDSVLLKDATMSFDSGTNAIGTIVNPTTWAPAPAATTNLSGAPATSQVEYVRLGDTVTYHLRVLGMSIFLPSTKTVMDFTLPIAPSVTAGLVGNGLTEMAGGAADVAIAAVIFSAGQASLQWVSPAGSGLTGVDIDVSGTYIV
jgi:hypothetical protein